MGTQQTEQGTQVIDSSGMWGGSGACGHGRAREIRGDLGALLFLRPRRTRCSGWKVTHVLLTEVFWPRRVDAAAVIGAGLEIAASLRSNDGWVRFPGRCRCPAPLIFGGRFCGRSSGP